MFAHFKSFVFLTVAVMVAHNLIDLILEDVNQILGRTTKTVANGKGEIFLQYLVRIVVITLCATIAVWLW